MRLRTRKRWLILAATLIALFAMDRGRVEAQTPSLPAAPVSRSVEIAVGGSWVAGEALGTAQANLITSSGGTLTLFSTSSRQAAGLGGEVSVGLPITRRLSAEVTGTWRRVTLETTTSGDFEHATSLTATQATSQFSVEGSAVFSVARRGRLEPFVRGGFGWMRQLSSDGILGENGTVANVGGGMKYWWREGGSGALKRLAFRAEIRAVARTGGIVLGSQRRFVSPAFAGTLILGF